MKISFNKLKSIVAAIDRHYELKTGRAYKTDIDIARMNAEAESIKATLATFGVSIVEGESYNINDGQPIQFVETTPYMPPAKWVDPAYAPKARKPRAKRAVDKGAQE